MDEFWDEEYDSLMARDITRENLTQEVHNFVRNILDKIFEAAKEGQSKINYEFWPNPDAEEVKRELESYGYKVTLERPLSGPGVFTVEW